MKLPYDENEEREERERKLRNARSGTETAAKNSKDVIKVFFCMMICLILMVVLLYGILLVLNFTRREKAAATEELTSPVISNAVVYSQEEVDARIAEAEVQAQKRGSDTVLNTLKVSFSTGMNTIEVLRSLYPEDLIVASAGKYHFVPINRQLRQNQLVPENLRILETGEYQYLQNGAVVSHKGIDVSNHQGKIDWSQVAADGVEFAFVRAIFRGYGSGKLVEDEQFDANMQGAISNGIKTGVYVFSQAISEEEILEEANLVLTKIAPYKLDCPVVFDVEMISGEGRMNALSAEERTNLTLLFCETIEQAGYKVMIYHNTEMAAIRIDLESLEKYDKWYASYSSKMFYPYEYKVWQYSDKGKVQGIKGNVDMNICIDPIWE